MIYDLIIVGGGASGMMAAITAAESGKTVLILEKMNRLGKKILATGNGRCNFTNSFFDDKCYRSSQSHFPYLAMEQFNYEDSIHFFERLGIFAIEKDGYYYPRSNQAAAIADALIDKINSLKIHVMLNSKVQRIQRQKHKFIIFSNEDRWEGHNLLIATGGKAQERLGSDGSGFELARSLGHKIIRPFPALTALEVNHHFLKEAAGVRCYCKIKARLNGKTVSTEQGELQITKYGVSGVMIFQLSRYLIKGLLEDQKAGLEIDFIPELKQEEQLIRYIKEDCYYKNTLQWLEGYLPLKLGKALLKKIGIPETKSVLKLSKEERQKVWNILKKCKLEINGWKGFDFAQVTAGGVNVNDISPYTMESDLVPGLFFAGEVVDVDGTCGGYNLQWAWTSGYLAGRSIE